MFNSDCKMTSVVEVANMATPLQAAFFKVLGIWRTGDYRALCRCYADNAEVFWTDTRTGEVLTACNSDEMIELWTSTMRRVRGSSLKPSFEFNEKDRVVTVTFAWEDSNFLNGSNVLIFDENYKVRRSNLVVTSQPGRVEEMFNRLFDHWKVSDFRAIEANWDPNCVQTVHNMKDGSTTVHTGATSCQKLMEDSSKKMEELGNSDFDVVNLTFNEETRQVMLVSKCESSGVHYWSGIYTYNEDLKCISLHIVMDRDW